MTVAVLFNSDHPLYDESYGAPIRNAIFGTQVLQRSGLHMKIRAGDVLTLSHSRTKQELADLSERTYFWHSWQRLDASTLRDTCLQATIFAWVIQNIDVDTAEALNDALTKEPAYLGMHSVDFAYHVHLVLYRNSMISLYRVNGKSCHIFFSMGSEEEKDMYHIEDVKRLHFDIVDWEDEGAHGTIFDDFDSLEHFHRVAEFKKVIAKYLPRGEDDAEEIVLLLEDLNPKLFNALGAAVRSLNAAQNDEDLSQVANSGRRYIEQIADALFPAQKQLFNGREVTKEKYINRIWAYIDNSIPQDDALRSDKIVALGKKINVLYKMLNSGVHAEPGKEALTTAFVDLALITSMLLKLNPQGARKPYLAFENNMQNFYQESSANFEDTMPDLDTT